MKLMEDVVKDMETLEPEAVLAIHDLIRSLKARREVPPAPRRASVAYERVREALRACRGQLADDVRLLREERV
jgi:hypothetical protein